MISQNSHISRKGVFIIASVLILAFIGCISIPLGDPEKAKVDDKLLGAWITKPSEGGEQTLFTVVPYDIPHGCAATYFPEANVLVPVRSVAEKSNTPASKSVVISIRPVTEEPE